MSMETSSDYETIKALAKMLINKELIDDSVQVTYAELYSLIAELFYFFPKNTKFKEVLKNE